ncbi:Ribonuclease Z [Purpureocillium takamizusanense]|uniref:ribonuclease Z n=1 Tax=Purpureocillium takamizusanense TaxID=2060973 RepID=A0A9Q8Q5D1_9HYPO|nr:Ribonuclease Z [Purpureocillium takamizusanense]UNI13973.1 Ribonuclease Z [Purpureocillium takamizusanense]
MTRGSENFLGDAPTMTTTVELATVPSADTPGSSIYLHHDKRSYIFGRVAEGTQRAFGSRKISIGRTDHVFLSGPVCWNQMGGLIGYLLSVGGAVDAARENIIQENVKREGKGQKPLKQMEHGGIGVHGGDNLCHILAACRPVIFRQPISVHTHEHRADPRAADATKTDPDWSDDAIRVWKLPIRRARSSSPPKRRHTSLEPVDGVATDNADPDETYKLRATVSDPQVAAMIVERLMFSGSLNNTSVLVRRKIRDLKPADLAVVVEQGTVKPFNKSSSPTTGAETRDQDETVWVFPDPKDTAGRGEAGDNVLRIRNFPLPRTTYSETSMSYIVKCHDRRGKFNAPAAKALGVKPEDFKHLTFGQSVQGKDGITVTPDMVLGEPQPGKGIVIADIPSHDFVDAFTERPEWDVPEFMENIAVVYWLLGRGMADDPAIQSFIKKHPQSKHVFCAEDTCPNMVTHPGAAEIQVKMRRIDSKRFPLANFDNTVEHPAPAPDSSMELGRAGTKLQLMPRLVFDDQAMAPFPDLVGASQAVDEAVLVLAEQARTEASDPRLLARIQETEKDIPNRDAEVIPLGTGSSVPSKHRNVSGTLIVVPGIGNYLLDCGEGTLGQIRRAFGAEQAADVLRNLRCIVISHLHADHHLGAASLVKAWYEQTLKDKSNATLAISCIGRYRSMLEELSQVEDIGFHRLRFPSCPWETRDRDRDVTTRKDLGDDNFGLASIKRVPVPHCWRSYGTQLELTSGLRIAYSGDCRPSSAFAQAFRGAHLLVHECTFGDDKQDHARAKSHSTMGEALGVAREMRARRTLLTHFSQRYTKADSLRRHGPNDGEGEGEGEGVEHAAGDGGEQNEHEHEHNVLLAFDLMRVRLGDFQEAACYVPAVQALMEKLAD